MNEIEEICDWLDEQMPDGEHYIYYGINHMKPEGENRRWWIDIRLAKWTYSDQVEGSTLIEALRNAKAEVERYMAENPL